MVLTADVIVGGEREFPIPPVGVTGVGDGVEDVKLGKQCEAAWKVTRGGCNESVNASKDRPRLDVPH